MATAPRQTREALRRLLGQGAVAISNSRVSPDRSRSHTGPGATARRTAGLAARAEALARAQSAPPPPVTANPSMQQSARCRPGHHEMNDTRLTG